MRSTIWLFQLVDRRNLPWIGWVIQVTQLRAHLTDAYVQLSQQFILQVFISTPDQEVGWILQYKQSSVGPTIYLQKSPKMGPKVPQWI